MDTNGKALINLSVKQSSSSQSTNQSSLPHSSQESQTTVQESQNVQSHRRLSLTLPLLQRHESPERTPSRDVINETNGLYLLLLSRQMTDLGMELGSIGNVCYTTSSENATSFRSLTRQFARSRQRRWVREQAESVDLDSLNFATFQQLLNGLFQAGVITSERVLVLFYFCTDLSIRVIREKFVNHFLEIYEWTTYFFSGRLAIWIEDQGGWGVVLENSANYVKRLSLFGICSASVLAVCLFMKHKN